MKSGQMACTSILTLWKVESVGPLFITGDLTDRARAASFSLATNLLCGCVQRRAKFTLCL